MADHGYIINDESLKMLLSVLVSKCKETFAPSGSTMDTTELKNELKKYTDDKILDIINGAPESMNTFKEVSDKLGSVDATIELLRTSVDEKIDSSILEEHTQNTGNPHKVTAAQVGLDKVENKSSEMIRSEITSANVVSALGYTPLESVGNSSQTADGLMSSSDKKKLDNISDEAEVNQNAFSSVIVGNTTISADSKTDALSMAAGTNVNIVADPTNDKVTISAVDTKYENATTDTAGLMSSDDKNKLDGIAAGANKYTHPSYTGAESGFYKVTVDGTGHVSNTIAVGKDDITALGIPGSDTTYEDATQTVHGLMSITDKKKLDGIASGAEVNQNAFSTIAVGNVKVVADAKSDTLTLVAGTNVTLTPDATNDKITIAATDTKYDTASQSTDGLMSAADKTKLDGIASGAKAGTITGVSVNGTSVATTGVANIKSIPASIISGAIPSAVTATTQAASDNSTKIATTEYVTTAINSLASPMIYKGTLGTGGTITALPDASADNNGYTYKVITAGTYQNTSAKVGDVFISDGSTWALIPSGDEPSGTVTSVAIKATSPIAVDSTTAITSSGTRTISHATSGVTAATYGTNSATALTPKFGDTFTVNGFAVNNTGHITSATSHTIKIPNDVFVKSGTGAAAGLVPAPSTTAGTTKYLREDGTWQVPPNTNTTYSDMKGATASAVGTHGLVPAPAAGKQTSFLRGDGTWVIPTNTTYADATTSVHGLMSIDDKKAIELLKSPYGICDTPRNTAEKVVTLENFVLTEGATIVVKFTDTEGTTNPTANLTLNVNGTGAKPIAYNNNGNKAQFTGGSSDRFYSNKTQVLTYDGTYWICITYNVNNTYANMKAATASAAGTAGLVPAPAAGAQAKFLRGDGTWQVPTNTDTKVTQNNTTDNASYRLLLSNSANETNETNVVKKSENFMVNPSTGAFYAKGYNRINITASTLDLDTLTLADGTVDAMYYINKTSGGAANITNIPTKLQGQPFLLDVELIRLGTANTDYIVMQTMRGVGDITAEYFRWNQNGTWKDWTKRVFTDTVYADATQSAHGLLTAADKKILDSTCKYATCSSTRNTVAKVVTLSNFVLQPGSHVFIKFTATDTANATTGDITLNVNGTGAKNVYVSQAYSSLWKTTYAHGQFFYNNQVHEFVYDGTQWIMFIGRDNNTTYSNATLGQGYGTCSTAAATAAKTVALTSYVLAVGGIVSIKFTYDVPANATLNINSRGAKAMYFRGAAIKAGVIEAGDTATFIYNGSQYHLTSIDRDSDYEVITETEIKSIVTAAFA